MTESDPFLAAMATLIDEIKALRARALAADPNDPAVRDELANRLGELRAMTTEVLVIYKNLRATRNDNKPGPT